MNLAQLAEKRVVGRCPPGKNTVANLLHSSSSKGISSIPARSLRTLYECIMEPT